MVRSSWVMSSRETRSPASGGRPKFSTQCARSGCDSAQSGFGWVALNNQPRSRKHGLAQLRLGHHTLFLGLLALGRGVVDQAVEQRGLQPVAQIGCGHGAA